MTSVTSSHVQIWKIVTKIVVGVMVLQNQETTKAIGFIYNLSIFRPISALIILTPFKYKYHGENMYGQVIGQMLSYKNDTLCNRFTSDKIC